jgi:hypothetical protein
VNRTRRCGLCLRVLPLGEFHRRRARENGNGRQSRCKSCNISHSNAHIKREIEENPKGGWLKYNLKQARWRAKRKSVPFSIVVEDIYLPEYCPVLGTRLNYFRSSGRNRYNVPSLDRVDPNRGYEPGNVRVISHRANTLKNNATISELKAVIRYMEEWGYKGLDSHGIINMG